MTQLPKELVDACQPTDRVGEVKRIHHLKQHDGSICSEGKDACLSVHRVHDGWMYKCFRCGICGKVKLDLFTPDQAAHYITSSNHFLSPPSAKFDNGKFISMPYDCEPLFSFSGSEPNPLVPIEASQWLLKHHIKPSHVVKYGLKWSPSYERIIFPIRSSQFTDVLQMGWNSIYGWIGRSLKPKSANNPKWLKRIRRDSQDICYHIRGQFRSIELDQAFVIVEDSVSAIRVAEAANCNAIALLGTSMPPRLWKSLRTMSVILWLDADAYAKGLALWKRLNQLGINCIHLSSSKDPKSYTDEKIQDLLNLI